MDGCGAPLFALTLTGLARAFLALVVAAPGTPERRVADAMRAHPEWTSGTSRDERRLMDAVPGLLLKGGAEGVDAFALADGKGSGPARSRSRTGRTGPGPRSRWRRCACSAPPSPTNSLPSPSSAARPGGRHPRGQLLIARWRFALGLARDLRFLVNWINL